LSWGLRWWRDVLILSQPMLYLDDRQARNTGLYRFVRLGNGPITDLKSSVHPLTSFYQMILRSIYRRFSRQSKLRSCLVSHGESLIFPSSLIVSSRVFLVFGGCIYCDRHATRGQGCSVLLAVPKSRNFKPRNGPIIGEVSSRIFNSQKMVQ